MSERYGCARVGVLYPRVFLYIVCMSTQSARPVVSGGQRKNEDDKAQVSAFQEAQYQRRMKVL